VTADKRLGYFKTGVADFYINQRFVKASEVTWSKVLVADSKKTIDYIRLSEIIIRDVK
jgi:hypothetical protein